MFCFSDQLLNDKTLTNDNKLRNGSNATSDDITSDELLNNHELNHSSDEDSEGTDEEPKSSTNLFESNVSIVSEEEFPPLSPLPDTVTVLEGPNGSKVYLVGTAHFSEKSQLDVSQVLNCFNANIGLNFVFGIRLLEEFSQI